ncbi:MAG: lipase family protein [Cyclobacteriaceae bacterium]
MKNYLRIYFAICVALLVSCKKEENATPPTVLVNSTYLNVRTTFELSLFIVESGLNLSSQLPKYNVQLYKVTYKTSYNGQPIIASGLVAIPNTTNAVPMVSFQHGTIAAHNEAPTTIPLNSTELILYSALASPGFIAVIPDFIGFGASEDIQHPYYIEDATAIPIIDLLKAANELAMLKHVSFNGKLFLAGYSQGGYATMATHKAIEENGLNGFDLVASFPSSGGYDIKGMQKYFFSLTTYDQPFFMAYVANAYKNYYGWSQPLTDFFQMPYASEVPGLFDGLKNGDQINALLTDTIPKLVNNDLIVGIDNNPKYTYIVNAFDENSLLDWFPLKKMFMYHGDADVTVPFQNSVDTYNKLISNGAQPSVLTFTPLVGATHYSGVEPYIEAFVPQMMALNEE